MPETTQASCDRCGNEITGRMYVLDGVVHPDVGAVGECCHKMTDTVIDP